MSRRLLASLLGKNRGRAARSDYRKRQRACLKVERLEERAMMTFAAATLVTPAPALHSLVGAPATLYLDFDGNFETTWSKHDFGYDTSSFIPTYSEMKDKRPGIITPAFDADGDGNPIGFSAADDDAMRKIWQRVAEDFAPFNIDVTTVDPGSFNNKQALRVAIGGSAYDWFQDSTVAKPNSGISSASSFTDSLSNVVYVFSDLIRQWDTAKFKDGDGRPIQLIPAVASTISHEAGHAFGLRHQSTFNANGTVKQDYNPGGASWTPIMGNSLGSDRTKWWNGMADDKMAQDDMAVMAGPASPNGFGYRPQEALRPLAVQSPYWSTQATSGVISKIAEGDMYWFSTSGGPTQISVVVAAESGPNLDATLTIMRFTPWAAPYSTMTFVGYVDAAPTSTDQGLNASYYNASLSGGMYYVTVGSHGTYGDVGQYTIAVFSGFRNVASIPPPPAPTGATYYGGGTGGSAYSWVGGASAGWATMAPDQAAFAPMDDHARGLMSLNQPDAGAFNRRGQEWSSGSGGQRRADKTVAANIDDPALTLLPANAGTIGGLSRAGGQLSPHDTVFGLPNDFLLDALLADLAVL